MMRFYYSLASQVPNDGTLSITVPLPIAVDVPGSDVPQGAVFLPGAGVPVGADVLVTVVPGVPVLAYLP